MPPEAAEIQRWIQKADHDHRAAQALLDQTPSITDAAAFHCQQAVEKLLKAYPCSRGAELEPTHDLRVLANICAEHDAAFETLRDTVAPLTAFAVRFRYPGPVDPPVEKVRDAITVIDKVHQFVMDRLA